VHDAEFVVLPDQQPLEYPNQQTAQFCELLQMENKFALSSGGSVEADGDFEVSFAED